MHILIGVLVGLFRGDVEVMGAINDRQRDVQYKLRGLDVSPYLGRSTGGEYQLAITPHTSRAQRRIVRRYNCAIVAPKAAGWLTLISEPRGQPSAQERLVGCINHQGKRKLGGEIKKKRKETEQNRRGERKELLYSVKGGSLCLSLVLAG